MVEWLYQIQLWYAVGAGVLLLLLAAIGRAPSGFSLGLTAGVLLGLMVQLAVSLGMVLAGERAAISTLEFFGYLIVAIFIPIGGGLWALVERTRWSTVVLGAAVLTVAVMLVRMLQIWTGIPVSFA